MCGPVCVAAVLCCVEDSLRGGGAVAQPRLRWLSRLCRGGEAAGRSRSLCQPPCRRSEHRSERRGERPIQKAQEHPSQVQGMPSSPMPRTSRGWVREKVTRPPQPAAESGRPTPGPARAPMPKHGKCPVETGEAERGCPPPGALRPAAPPRRAVRASGRQLVLSRE